MLVWVLLLKVELVLNIDILLYTVIQTNSLCLYNQMHFDHDKNVNIIQSRVHIKSVLKKPKKPCLQFSLFKNGVL